MKRFIIVALVGANLMLLLMLFAIGTSPDAAFAQGRSGGSKYLAVTCEVIRGTDALVLYATDKGMMSVLAPQTGSNGGRLRVVANRDVANMDLNN